MIRVALCGLWHETNTFAALPTTQDQFHFLEGDDLTSTLRGTRTPIGGFLNWAAHEGVEVIPTVFAWALPSGTVEAAVHQHLVGRLVDGTIQAQPDAVLLDVHGAMVAEGCDDVEGDLVRRLRSALPGTPLGAVLDFHANTTTAFIDVIDVMSGYDTYPHADPYDRGLEVAGLLMRVLRRDLRPMRSLVQPPLLIPPQAQATGDLPMRGVMGRAHDVERDPRVITVTVAAGFPYADVPSAGMSVTVTTHEDADLARELAEHLARAAWDARARFQVTQMDPEAAVARALQYADGPVILVDSADNIGGGSPGDGTALLAALLDARARGAVVEIVDAGAVARAREIGEGGVLATEVGGKTDRWHGVPVPVRAKIVRLLRSDFTYKGSYMTGRRVESGWAVLLDADGIHLVLRERKVMPFDQEALKVLGLEPARCRIIVVKSAIAWRAAYGALARAVIEVDTPGVCTANLKTLPYRRVRRPIVPLDDDVAW